MPTTSSPSRRSTHSAAPTWHRTLSVSKSQQPASVSLVFAQPEQGSKLQSAVDHLPAIALDDSSSAASIMSRKRERFQSTSTMDEETVEQDLDWKRTRVSPHTGITPLDHVVEVQSGGNTDQSLHTSQSSPTPELQTQVRMSPAQSISFSVTHSLSPQDAKVQGNDQPLSVSPQSLDMGQTLSEPTESLPQRIPTPTPDPQNQSRKQSSQPSSPTPRSSWFGSLSGARRQEQSTSAKESPKMLTVPDVFSTNTTSVATGPTCAQSIPIPTQVLSGTSPPTSASPQQREVHPIPTIVTSGIGESPSISSVDEEVPRPRLASGSPPAEPGPAMVECQGNDIGRKVSMSDLNPSASRFSLRLPLLGRPKVPLQQAVGNAEVQAKSDDQSEPRKSAEPAKEESKDVGPVRASQDEQGKYADALLPPVVVLNNGDVPSVSVEAQEVSIAPPLESDHGDEDGTPRADGHAVSASSWWDYIGWGRSQEEVSAKAQPEFAPEELAPAAAHEETRTPVQEPPPAVVVEPAQDASGVQENEAEEESMMTATADKKPPSVFSAETSKSQNSAWYSPWAWYTSSPIPASDGAGMSQTQAAEARAEPETEVKTESEIVKEQALARDGLETAQQSQETSPVPPESAKSPSLEVQNPIHSSLNESRSGWVNFFMSRALLTKSIAEDAKERDEHGAEVMHIDDDEPVGSTAIEITPQQSQSEPQSAQIIPQAKHAHKSTASLSLPGTSPKRAGARTPSPVPSNKSNASASTSPRAPQPSPRNLVLPTWEDVFLSPPRSDVPPRPQSPGPKSKLSRTLSLVSGVLFNKDEQPEGKGKGKEREREHQKETEFLQFGMDLPKALEVIGGQFDPYLLNGGCRVAVIGVAGWSPGPVTRTFAGGFPSSSSKFVDMTCQALEQFEQEHKFKFKKVTKIPLEGDGIIERKVSKVHEQLLDNEEWMEDLHAADVIFVACHSQGCIVATHLIDRLLHDGHILTRRNVDLITKTAATIAPGRSAVPTTQAQRICCLSLCGIHLGPLRYLRTSSLLQPYIQYFENAAARELFEFQNTESRLSRNYVRALQNVMDHGTKMVYIASLNDQVVPIYSGLFTAASHPRILRALYIDGDAYHSSDFLSNLLVLLIRIMNSGLSDGGLINHLSEATAGTLSGVGHSSVYEEPATFSLAVKYFFLTTDSDDEAKNFVVEPFNAAHEQNDYEIPWSLRDMIADERVAHYFASDFAHLRDAFDDWQPKTTILRDVKRKLQPIQRLTSFTSSVSKL